MKRSTQMFGITGARSARILAATGTAAVIAVSGAPSAVADPTNPVAVCSSQKVAGVDVDNCGPNPNADSTTDGPDDYFDVVPRFRFGVGLGF